MATSLTPRPGATILALLVALTLLPAPGSAECTVDSIVPPSDPGEDGGTWLDNYFTLVDELYQGEAVRTLTIDGEIHLAPPWFDSSTACEAMNLREIGPITSPTFDDYAINGDELSELGLVIALADDPDRMRAFDRTVDAMSLPGLDNLPCWYARARRGPPASIECVPTDSASDITARIGLAYYHAAANPHFTKADRGAYRLKADALVDAHLMHEYAHGESYMSSVTWNMMSDWVGGGAATTNTFATMDMWIAYHPDIVLFLLAAHHSTADPAYLQRAEEVVDQWLIASGYDGTNLSFGCFVHGWEPSEGILEPVLKWSECSDHGLAWDTFDSPRALWIGHTLRARSLATSGAPPSDAFAELIDWIELLLTTGTHTSTTACIQYELDGDEIPGNCGTNYYYNGLGTGLVTHLRPSWIESKLDTMLPQYGWSAHKTWDDGFPCFGIYLGIRPVKALAAALGLDAATFGGDRPQGCIALDVTRSGAGAGFVLDAEGGIDCGVDCSDLYSLDTAVTLNPIPYEGSAFAGWSGAGCGTGAPLLDVPRACTATFTGTCDPFLDLSAQTITGSELFAGCGEISAGDGFEVASSGDVTFRAGDRIVLRDGFSVLSGGAFAAVASAEP